MPLITVELPGLTLTNEKGQTAPYLVDLRNWHNSSETRRDSEQRDTGFGLFPDDDPTEGGRYPIVVGELRSLREGDEWNLRQSVMALKSVDGFELTVTDPSGAWRSDVAVSGRIEFDLIADGWCRFEIPLEAADPRRYGPAQSGSTGVPTPGVGVPDPITDPVSEGAPGNLGRVSVVNTGTAPSEPRVRVTGGLSGGFELRHIEVGRVIRVTREIFDGSFVDIDMGSGAVWIDDQSPVPASDVPVSEWVSVAPGATATLQFTPLGVVTGTPTMTVEWAVASW